jgi:hypothetical protein
MAVVGIACPDQFFHELLSHTHLSSLLFKNKVAELSATGM